MIPKISEIPDRAILRRAGDHVRETITVNISGMKTPTGVKAGQIEWHMLHPNITTLVLVVK